VTATPERLSAPLLAPLLESILEPTLGATEVRDVERLKGGYSREMWSFDAIVKGRRRPLILCADTSVGVVGQGPQALDRVKEAALLHSIHGGGLPVPDTLAAGGAEGLLGRPFLVMERLPGTTAIGPFHRDPRYVEHRARLARQLADILARIHRAEVREDIFGSRPDPTAVAPQALAQWTAELDRTPGAQTPTLARAVSWLSNHVPVHPARVTLVHGDYRTGNILHDDGPDGPQLLSVVDWEMAHLGDPLEDVAWTQLVCWRVNTGRVGGLVGLDEWVQLYAEASGQPVDPEALRFWEVLGSVKMTCLMHRAANAVPDQRERALLERLSGELANELDSRLLPDDGLFD
jgi:aminoglycoside phosphotransferase (APT) family kinase protein